MADPPAPDHLVTLPDGRRMAVDDRGDPGGRPVLYLHGTPDSRRARHPDDGIAAGLGIRLLAPDRPGIGASDPDPVATPASVADDLVAVLDALDVERSGVLAWSAGSIHALALAGRHPDRVERVVLAAPLVPADGYDDAAVLDGADDARRLFAEAQRGLGPDEVGTELAVWLVPPDLDDPTARELLSASLRAVAAIPGAGDQLVEALRASVARGMTGLEREITAQAMPLGAALDAIRCPVAIHTGADDVVAPPAMGSWLADRLGVEAHVHAGEGHALPLLRWSMFLDAAAGSSHGTTGTSDHSRSSS